VPPATAAAVEKLQQAAQAIGVDIDAWMARQFSVYIDTLLLWRERLSLTGADSAQLIVRDHVVDSLFLCRLIDSGQRVADIGSGAGFPGLPLAIARPDARFSLIESRRKRANFLREVVRQAAIANAHIVDDRAEVAAKSLGSCFDVVTARALGSITVFLAVAAPLLKSGGLAIAMKGPKALAETMPESPDFRTLERIPYNPSPGVSHLLLTFKRN